jgi:uncharacterized protein (DUF2249 family)
MEDITSYLSQTDAPDSQTAETLDARELPPPQPLKNTLEQLTEIDDSVVLVQLNDRRPQHLYPELDDRGYEYETLDIDDGIVTVIWKE